MILDTPIVSEPTSSCMADLDDDIQNAGFGAQDIDGKLAPILLLEFHNQLYDCPSFGLRSDRKCLYSA